MESTNPLQGLLPARVRQILYAILFVAGLVFALWQAAEGDWLLFHYYNEGSQVHPMHLHQFDQIVLARDGFPLDSPYVADVINVAPGERYSVLVLLDKPGTWMWHCHILPHVENDTGMFGMVTALVVQAT